jgi:hypothetical protein
VCTAEAQGTRQRSFSSMRSKACTLHAHSLSLPTADCRCCHGHPHPPAAARVVMHLRPQQHQHLAAHDSRPTTHVLRLSTRPRPRCLCAVCGTRYTVHRACHMSYTYIHTAYRYTIDDRRDVRRVDTMYGHGRAAPTLGIGLSYKPHTPHLGLLAAASTATASTASSYYSPPLSL